MKQKGLQNLQPFVLYSKFEGSNLALRKLEASTRLAFTIFLAFHHAAVTCKKTCCLQCRSQVWIKELKRF